MRLLIVPATFPYPGDQNASIWLLRQCQALSQHGHEIRVAYAVPFAPPLGAKWNAYNAIPAEYVYENIRVNVIRAIMPPKMLWLRLVQLQVRRALRALVAEFRPDIVHVHCLIPPGFLAIGLDPPVVLTAHGSDAYLYPSQRSDLRHAAIASIQAAARVVAVSTFVKLAVERLGARGVRVVHNGADPRVFSPQDRSGARKDLSFAADRPLIVYAGTVERPKGLFDLVKANQFITDLQPLFVIAGKGPHVAEVEKAFAEADAQALFVGELTQPQLAKLFTAADVITLPSHGEGLPTVLCEAMLSGRAVVATDVGGIPEIVRNGETGLVVPVGDVKAIATALRSVLTDAALRARFENNAHEFAAQQLTWNANVHAYEEIYADVLGQRHRAPDK